VKRENNIKFDSEEWCGEISGSHGDEYEDVFWGVATCSVPEIDWCFKDAYYRHRQS
jgi:hypothetical protein